MEKQEERNRLRWLTKTKTKKYKKSEKVCSFCGIINRQTKQSRQKGAYFFFYDCTM
jgi:hypothetical protein